MLLEKKYQSVIPTEMIWSELVLLMQWCLFGTRASATPMMTFRCQEVSSPSRRSSRAPCQCPRLSNKDIFKTMLNLALTYDSARMCSICTGFCASLRYWTGTKPIICGTCINQCGDKSGDLHEDVMTWKHFPYYWPFVKGIHRSPIDKGPWCGALFFPFFVSLIKLLNQQLPCGWFGMLRQSCNCHCKPLKPF